jgi:hypothetical protein
MTTNEVLNKMIDLVKAGRWTRNTTQDSGGNMCAYGLVSYVVTGDATYGVVTGDATYGGGRPLLRGTMLALHKAIEMEEIRVLMESPAVINGGNNHIRAYCRGQLGMDPAGVKTDTAVTGYNNTRADEQEIIDWFERAKTPEAPAFVPAEWEPQEERELVPA